jgi:hypothetical protein
MTTMLTRDVIDNRILRETGQLDTTLGAGMRATFEMPTLTELVGEQFDGFNAFSGLTPEERIAAQTAEAQRKQDIVSLQDDLLSETDAARKEEIVSRLEELQRGPQDTMDTLSQQAVADGRMRSQEDLQQQYGDLGLTFDRAMTDEEANHIAARKREEITRQAIIEAGPKGVLPGAARFGAGLAAMAVDPLEIATAFIPVVGPAGRAAAVGRFGRVGGRAAVGVTEGFVGNLITEPLYYGLSRSQQLDYDMNDALMNVGLGAVFGGALGAGAGVLSRSVIDVPVDTQARRLDASLERESAEIALRQFATDQSVNISRFLDGTDLRSTTSLSRVGGIEFQADLVTEIPVGNAAIDLRPTVIAQSPDGTAKVFTTVGKADVFAEKVDGSVIQHGDGFAVRRPISGGIVRDPYGKPTTFKTERAAQKFIDRAREIPDAAKPVRINVNGKPTYAVARDMSEADRVALERGAETAEIPDGVNTREVAELPDAAARMDEAVRKVFAETQAAKQYAAEATSIEADPLVNVEASQRADIPAPETFAQDTLDDMEAIVRDLEKADTLTPAAKAELAEVKDIEIKARSYRAASEAATTCLLGA